MARLPVVVCLLVVVVANGQNVRGGVQKKKSFCGKPTDGCMDENNWKHCMLLERRGCKNIEVLESCPVQFLCGDAGFYGTGKAIATEDMEKEDMEKKEDMAKEDVEKEDVEKEDMEKEDMEKEDVEKEDAEKEDMEKEDETTTTTSVVAQPSRCVTLEVYEEDKYCRQETPPRRVVFSTWSEPGSPCFHDTTMPNLAMENQFCNDHIFKSDFYMNQETCDRDHLPIWKKMYNPMRLIFLRGVCMTGIKFLSCEPGPCAEESLEGSPFFVANIHGV